MALSPFEIRDMIKNGDPRSIGEIRRQDRKAERSKAQAGKRKAKASTAPSPAPKASPSSPSGQPQPLTSEQQRVVQELFGGDGQAPQPAATIQAPAGKGFMQLVEEHQAANNCSKSESMRAIMDACPEAHQAWLQSWQEHSPQVRAKGSNIQNHKFWTQAEERSRKDGISLGKAIAALAKEQPQLHAQFLEEVNADG